MFFIATCFLKNNTKQNFGQIFGTNRKIKKTSLAFVEFFSYYINIEKGRLAP
jgi:hypothetical protein